MERKNILFLHHVSCLGGAERYLISLIEQLGESFQPFFISQNPGPLTEILSQKDVEAAFIKMRAWRRYKYYFKNLSSGKEITQFCRDHNIQLICCNAYRITPFALIASRKLKIPCITIVHDFVPYIKLKRFKVFQSDAVISVSESIDQTVAPNFKRKTHVVYNGIDPQKFSQLVSPGRNIRDELNIAPEQKIVGIVAHIIPLKGHELFLEAMKKVSEECPEATFVLVGESPDENQLTIEDLKSITDRLGITERVHFLGYRDDVPDLIAAFDILVLASDREAFGRVLIEAMSLQKAVVATRCGGPDEIVLDNETGFLVEKDDSNGLADAVIKLIKDDALRQRFGQKGLARVQEKFDAQETGTQFNRLLDSYIS